MAKTPKKVASVLASIPGNQATIQAAVAQIAAALGTPESIPDLLYAKAAELTEMADLLKACNEEDVTAEDEDEEEEDKEEKKTPPPEEKK
jgi:hypothetical protein